MIDLHRLALSVLLVCGAAASPFRLAADEPTAVADDWQRIADFIEFNCVGCHSGPDAERGFQLDDRVAAWKRAGESGPETEPWEKALLRIQSRQMPPPDAGQPSEDEYRQAEQAMVRLLDRQAAARPYAGRTAAVRRMTRTEYRNAIRDLLALEPDVESILPADSSSDGFDNITVADLSPLLIDRYLTAARRISRAALGVSVDQPGGVTLRVPADQTQAGHVDGLPWGTRGGTLIDHHFPRDGEYEIQVRLTRDRDERIEGLHETHQLDVLLDRQRAARFELEPVRGGRDYSQYDAHLNARVRVSAGRHRVGVTFVENSTPLLEIKREPFHASYNRHRHPRRNPAVHEVSIVGPFQIDPQAELAGESESRRAVLIARPGAERSADEAARVVFRHLMRRAYRRPVVEADLDVPMRFFRQVSESTVSAEPSESDRQRQRQRQFERGIEAGLTSVLINPNFLLRTLGQPQDLAPGTVYPLDSFELASRLSFFLWSSLPDEALLAVAESGQLLQPAVLEQQTRRLLRDDRSGALVDNFADQWLYLRNLATITPNLRQFPDFDHNLRQAFAEETKHVFADVIRRDASVLELIDSDYTFLNQRLATHYGIPGVVGNHFRRVELRPQWHRGGLLRHGSILTATSYATRTSPTIRGAWVLENILGTPPPPPPPNVPTIKKEAGGEPLTFREALAAHRSDAACASCHDLIDPVGFALDRYDAVGRWRPSRDGTPVDASGRLPDGQTAVGVEELERGILERPELFVRALVEKLMTYAVGRPMSHADGPAIRRIVRDAAEDHYRVSDLIVGITRSTPFLKRTSQ